MTSSQIFTCPHCQLKLMISEMNCKIFRHGVVKSTMKQVNPHETKENCMRLRQTDKIYGCGLPFQITPEGKIQKCDYI